jgi:hypothetical protein
MAYPDATENNPAANFVRLALVRDLPTLREALRRLTAIVDAGWQLA